MANNVNAEISTDRSWISAFCTALRFLTIIPVTWRSANDGDHFGRSLVFFPFIGVLIGLGGYALVTLASLVFPLSVVSFLLVFYLGGISGFLHMDGVSDSGDGLLSYRSRERALEIMKDSRVGAMGVIVVVLLLLGKYAVFTTFQSGQLAVVGLLAPIGGRLAILYSMELFPYARKEGGLGGMFYSSYNRLGTVFGSVLLFFFTFYNSGLLTGIAIVFFVFAFAAVFGWFSKIKLGGVTGDILGATCELTEFMVSLLLCALLL